MEHGHYLGCGRAIGPEGLSGYEDFGGFIVQEKVDGKWGCYCNRLWSRKARPLPDGERILESIVDRLGPGNATVLVGEVTPHSFHVFDMPVMDHEDLRDLGFLERQERLRALGFPLVSRSEAMANRVPVSILPFVDSGFEGYFNDVVANGGEGVVLKEVRSLYRGSRRRNDLWIKVKKRVTAVYHLVGVDVTSSGVCMGVWARPSPTGNAFIHSMRAAAPGLHGLPTGGQVIAEFEGLEVLPSGAMREASFVRWIDDPSTSEETHG